MVLDGPSPWSFGPGTKGTGKERSRTVDNATDSAIATAMLNETYEEEVEEEE